MALCCTDKTTQSQKHKPGFLSLQRLHLYCTLLLPSSLLTSAASSSSVFRWDCFSGGCGYFTARGEHATPSHASASSTPKSQFVRYLSLLPPLRLLSSSSLFLQTHKWFNTITREQLKPNPPLCNSQCFIESPLNQDEQWASGIFS